jgi:hypothetical protein
MWVQGEDHLGVGQCGRDREQLESELATLALKDSEAATTGPA